MSKLKSIEQLLVNFAGRTPVRAGSLIISIFGDVISQHGNSVWLGSLINILEPFGLNQRQIRTAVFRLVKEDWLYANHVGRRSYYSLTDFGIRHYEKAARRIYMDSRPRWNGKWTIVIPAFTENKERDDLRKELIWLGFGLIAPGVLAHPATDRQSLDETIDELGLRNKVVVMDAELNPDATGDSFKKLIHSSWKLEEIASRYNNFNNNFQPIYQGMKKVKEPDREQCFQVGTLLIHEYRRILLKDSDLPEELLPSDWCGITAANLAKDLYRLVHQRATEYIMEKMESEKNFFPEPCRSYKKRFGGLP